MTAPLRLGIIGLSEGNGHPYSWSAIFNGYDPEAMKKCPFPVIPEYLACQCFPKDAISTARVTHVWTQERALSEHIAQACRIGTVVDDYREMIGAVDGVLLARDDAETHFEFAAPFLGAGLPVYIDKPLALTVAEARRIYAQERYPGQIFTCSALSYAREFQLDGAARRELGRIRHVHGTAIKDWDRYAVHVIEPALKLVGRQGDVTRTRMRRDGGARSVDVTWESGLEGTFSTPGTATGSILLQLTGTEGARDMVFEDTFHAFRAALDAFVRGVRERRVMAERDFVLEVVSVIEAGREASD